MGGDGNSQCPGLPFESWEASPKRETLLLLRVETNECVGTEVGYGFDSYLTDLEFNLEKQCQYEEEFCNQEHLIVVITRNNECVRKRTRRTYLGEA